MNVEQQRKAFEWYQLHKQHVNKIRVGKGFYKPSGEDVSNPSWWKPEHWNWFIDHYLIF